MKPSAALSDKRTMVRDLIARSCVTNPRIFGSVLRGDDTEGSDLDLLVDALPLPERIRNRVLEEAKPL